MTTVLASGANERYGYWLLNLVGSVQRHSDLFDRIVLFDLGLSPLQQRLAASIRGAELRSVPPFVPHWRQGRTWKTWIWTHVEAERLFWLDAGAAVLRPLDAALDEIDKRGYFVVSQGHEVADSIPSDYYGRFAFSRELGVRTSIAAGILGFSTRGDFFDRVITPTFEAAAAGFSLGFSPTEVEKLNYGLDETDSPIIRDCPLFRHEQTLLNIYFYSRIADPYVSDLDQYGGWRGPHDHPRQVIWSHRRRGDLAQLPYVRYRFPLRTSGIVIGAFLRVRWWTRNHSWLFRPRTYFQKARRLAASPRR